ncbi:MAG: ABC transporter ATP-binding protein [Clostridia bacterium]|nr:ABC transporter ATP-binding protein [Clostridia bacterium]
MLRLENICKTYPKKKKSAVDGLSFEVKKGEVFALVGPKNAGLTSVVKMVAGVTAPDRGLIFVNGRNNADWPVNCRRYIGYVPEIPRVYRWMDKDKWLDFIANVYGLTADEKKDALVRYKGLFRLRTVNGRFSSYSAEEIQRVMLVSALISEPKLLVMDEPFISLGDEMRRILASECKNRAAEGRSVFFTANTLSEAGICADRIGLMCGGRLIAVGTEESLRAKWAEALAGTEMESVFEKPQWAREE